MMNVFLKGMKLEVESVLRETCERVLEDPTITREKAQLRAVALQMLGEAYMNVKKDDAGEDSDYVKVETKQSRARNGTEAKQDARGGR
jgi:DnaJ-like protein